MTRAQQMQRLLRVTETGMNAALLEVRTHVDARQAIDQRIAELEEAHRSVLYNPVMAATLSGADQRWLVWAEEERRRLNAALARARVTEARARAAAAKSFGRHQAMQGVISKASG